MTWNARVSLLGSALALGLILIAFWTTKAYGATLIGFASGVALCAFWPEVERWLRGFYTGLYKGISPDKLGALVFGARQPDKQPDIELDKIAQKPPFTGDLVQSATGLLTGLGRVLGFLLRHWFPILLIVTAITVIGGLRAISIPFAGDFGKDRGEIKLERELARAEAELQEAVNARDAIIAQAAQQAAVHRAQIELLSEQGRLAIEAATPEHETAIDPELERAWRDALNRLRVYPSGDAATTDPGGRSA